LKPIFIMVVVQNSTKSQDHIQILHLKLISMINLSLFG